MSCCGAGGPASTPWPCSGCPGAVPCLLWPALGWCHAHLALGLPQGAEHRLHPGQGLVLAPGGGIPQSHCLLLDH